MNIYYVEFNGTYVKTRVVAESSLVCQALEELKLTVSSMSTCNRVVGIDMIRSSPLSNILVLHIRELCVIFNFTKLYSLPSELDTFLNDNTICFVGLETINAISCGNTYTKNGKAIPMTTHIRMVKLGELAGRILKKPSLCKSSNLEDIAKEIGHGVKVPSCPTGLKIEDSDQLVYSPEAVKAMMCKAYTCWLFADKLFDILPEVSARPAMKRPKFEAA